MSVSFGKGAGKTFSGKVFLTFDTGSYLVSTTIIVTGPGSLCLQASYTIPNGSESIPCFYVMFISQAWFPYIDGGYILKKALIIALVLGIAALSVSAGGCTDIVNPLSKPSPTPYVIYGPVSPTPTPTPAPNSAATHAPQVVVTNSRASEAVELIIAPVDTKVFTAERGINGQYENFTMFVWNHDSKDVKNVNIILTIRDNGGSNIHYQIFDVGDFARGEQRQVWLVTDEHQDVDFMIVKFKVVWGENGEYYSPQEYQKNLRSFVY
ncbi:hypothetical protein [Methanocella arvoryzae]|uniref:Uncharacterized protein n=1 Tax=Methanocella arvoryzae (strain DSM 22066 / NBRC 105507 / MRE50) TaxID=351160 RepID=Q0W4S3_METAR|nr:hypothetical protein [Methanocella arvoryzae]CAJ36620.1 hypothetical protein RCIX1332 [Methanocella arvoryzae MRE50]